MKSTSALKSWGKAGESEGCCSFVHLKMEDVEGTFIKEQNAMSLSLNSMLMVRFSTMLLMLYNLMEQEKVSLF